MERGSGERVWTRRAALRGMAAGVGVLRLPAWGELPAPGKLRGVDGGLRTSGGGSLRAHAEARGLMVGCAVNVGLLAKEPAYGRVLAEQFDLLVGENCMKWGQLRPTATTYDWTGADALMDFAKERGLKVRGHNLCWHENLPDWFAGEVTKENARRVLEEHIRTVVGRYRGRVESWDVVNEAIEPKDGLPHGMRRSVWWELIGPEYVEVAFRAARAADPEVVLVYNDFGVEYDVPEQVEKRVWMLALVERLVRAGVGIGGVGVQSHLRTEEMELLGPGVVDLLRALGRLGMRVYLSEMDVNDNGISEGGTVEQDRAVAAVYGRYLEQVLREPCVKGLLVWGLADQHSWLQEARMRVGHLDRLQRPLLLSEVDGAFQGKPALYAVRNAMDDARRR